jgi:hypothetical protein
MRTPRGSLSPRFGDRSALAVSAGREPAPDLIRGSGRGADTCATATWCDGEEQPVALPRRHRRHGRASLPPGVRALGRRSECPDRSQPSIAHSARRVRAMRLDGGALTARPRRWRGRCGRRPRRRHPGATRARQGARGSRPGPSAPRCGGARQGSHDHLAARPRTRGRKREQPIAAWVPRLRRLRRRHEPGCVLTSVAGCRTESMCSGESYRA